MSQQVKVSRSIDFQNQGSGSTIQRIDCDDSSSTIYWRPTTDDTGTLYIGDGTTDMDVKIFLGTTAKYALFDVGNSALTLAGITFTMGSSGTTSGDFTLWGTTASYKVWFDVDGDTNGAFYFGADDYGVDVGFYGQTASNSALWDASANAFVFTAAGITMGVASKFVLPVKASGSTTSGDIWLDTTDYTLHFYANGAEYTVTAS